MATVMGQKLATALKNGTKTQQQLFVNYVKTKKQTKTK